MPGRSTVFEHESEAGTWRTIRCDPHPALAPYVRRYVGWVERTAFARRKEFASTDVVLIFSLGWPLRIIHPATAIDLRVQSAFVGGVADAPLLTESNAGVGGGLQVDFTPIGARLVLGMSMMEVASRSIEFSEIHGRDGRVLAERLADCVEWDDRFEAVERWIIRRLSASTLDHRGVLWAWTQIRQAHGNVNIAVLADRAGWSPKHLAGRFTDYFGHSPKKVARIVRFRHALDELDGNSPALAEVSHASGYFDQPHFNRDFREFSGMSPTEYLRYRLPDGGGIVAV